MHRTIVGLAIVAALGFLAAGANFGCSQSSTDQMSSSPGAMPSTAAATTNPNATVNNRCPINGAPFNPNDVPDVLVRHYKGMKVGFCCGGHPEMWDKLSDADKDAKLAAVMTPPPAQPAPPSAAPKKG